MRSITFPVSRPSLGLREQTAVRRTLQSGWVTTGPQVARFEARLSRYLRVEHVVACANGTVALHLALAACRLGPGDEVLVPSLTYVATANAVTYVGATPVLVDVDPLTWNLDLRDAALKVTPRTKAILPVHLYGVPADMRAIDQFAGAHKLLVIEDAAEALGATKDSRRCGTFGVCGTFSFFGNKVITTGEGGAVATNDGILATRLRLLRGQGMSLTERYMHTEVGFNYRLTDIQAAIGVVQMSRVTTLLRRRAHVAFAYGRAFRAEGLTEFLTTQHIAADAMPIAWQVTVALRGDLDRNTVTDTLRQDGIETRPIFVPLHRMPMYRQMDAVCPVASDLGGRGFSLPTYPDLPIPAVSHIVKRLARAIRRAA